MDRKKARYKKMEVLVTGVLCVDTLLFLAYMIFAGMGLIAWKVIFAILCFLISGAVLYFLFMNKELLKRRSRWMTLAAGCNILCVLVSLILKFPAPRFVLPTV